MKTSFPQRKGTLDDEKRSGTDGSHHLLSNTATPRDVPV